MGAVGCTAEGGGPRVRAGPGRAWRERLLCSVRERRGERRRRERERRGKEKRKKEKRKRRKGKRRKRKGKRKRKKEKENREKEKKWERRESEEGERASAGGYCGPGRPRAAFVCARETRVTEKWFGDGTSVVGKRFRKLGFRF